MSDAIWLALIAMVSKGWTDTMGLLMSPTGVSITGFLMVLAKQWWDGRQTKAAAVAAKQAHDAALASREILATKLDENTQLTQAVKESAVRSQHEVTQAFQAGERSGYVRGIPEGRRQATGPMPLDQ